MSLCVSLIGRSVCAHYFVYTHPPWLSWEGHLHVWVCLRVYFWRIFLVNHLPHPSKTNGSSLDASSLFITPAPPFFFSPYFFEGRASLLHVRQTLPVVSASGCLEVTNMLLVNHYLPCPLYTGPTDLLSKELKQTASNTSVCYRSLLLGSLLQYCLYVAAESHVRASMVQVNKKRSICGQYQ